jgi:hypothetical protein
MERVARYLACNPYDPKQAFDLATTTRQRRRARGGSIPPGVWASQQLRDWLSDPGSALLQLRGSVFRAEQSRDLASDLIQLVQTTSLPVIWYLSNASPTGWARVSVINVLRSLIEQAMSQHPPAQGSREWNLNDMQFQNCKTDKDWLRLFVAVIHHIPKLVIVIDAHQEASDNLLDVMREFWDEMKDQNITTIVKILVLTYGNGPAALLSEFPVFSATSKTGGRTPRMSRAGARAGSARTSRVYTARVGALRSTMPSQGPEQLEPLVLQLASDGE